MAARNTNLLEKSDLPEGWGIVDFESCLSKVKFERDKQIPTKEYLENGRFPIVDQGVKTIAGYTNNEDKIINNGLPFIIFGDHTRAVKYIESPIALGADGTKLIKPINDFDPRFFYFQLLFINIPSRGYNRHYPLLKEQKILKPQFSEQQAIAETLSSVQLAISEQKNLIEKLRELKRSMMHELFTLGTRGERTKMTEIGEIPESWNTAELSTVCEKPEYGFTDSASTSGNAKFLRITDITESGVNWETVPFCSCDNLERYQLKNNDIVFARIGATTGKSYIIENPPSSAVYASYLIRVRARAINPEYLCYFFETDQYWKQINSQKGASLKGGVNGSILSKLIIPVCTPEEQLEIVSIFNAIDSKIKIHSEKLNSFEALFKTLLQELMSGKRRVNF